MSANPPELAPATTRLGLLQRGRGAGFVAAQQAAAEAHDDLLACVLVDPRRDRTVERRARYYGELLVATGLPLEPLLAALPAGAAAVLAHDVLAAAWVLGHAPTRELLAAAGTDDALLAGITACLWSERWATPVQLPPRAAAAWLRLDLQDADSARAQRRPLPPTPLATLSLDAVLELARGPQPVRRDRLLGELCARGDEATRQRLAEVVADDPLFERVRLAARALGLLGDERLLPLAEDLFGREDVFAERARRLPGELRMRRACLADYACHLPGALALPLARAWHARGGHFGVVAGQLFEQHATAADRAALEAFVGARAADGGAGIVHELDALGRLADPASLPLLVEVACTAADSLARRHAVHALTGLAALPAAQAVLREALWDAEDDAVAAACAFVAEPDAAARQRLAQLAVHPLVDGEVAARAAR
ncbi:MAG: HEAT repeat domain-containing protein [Planctomycetes bacterium]|nr:HEAT repeat domain-containing protein [Planctomycetota bacterium]